MDVAKGLLDRGYMAPTVYFPLVVPECMMIEPTETESRTPSTFAEHFAQVLKRTRKRSAPPSHASRRGTRFCRSASCATLRCLT